MSPSEKTQGKLSWCFSSCVGELGEVAREWSAAQGPTEQRGRQPEAGESGQEALKPPGPCDHDVSSLADEAV